MTSFESIDRLRQCSQALPPQFLDGTTTTTCHETAPPRSRRKETSTATSGGKTRGLVRGTGTTRQLTQAQRMEAISRVTGGIAHNFNNLLTGIMGFCDLLADRSGHRTDDGPCLDRIMTAATRGGDLVQQLLAFSQQQILDPEVFDINRAVADYEPLLRRATDEHINVTFDLEPAPGPVRADLQQIERVISNLATNAVEAMPEGGRLTLRTRHLELDDFSISHIGVPQGSYVLLEIEDTGAGIDESIYDRIFEPFFSTKDQLNGTGLGLSVVYGIVMQCDGHIRVESSPDLGTRFRVYLPRTDRRQEVTVVPEPLSAPTIADQPAGRQQTILLAEDEPTIRQALETFLTKRGYQVLPVADGVEGVELSDRHDGDIDLLLSDIVMPRMDGLVLAQTMLAQRTDTKVLFISGYTQEREILCELLEGTEVDFLKKPFENECLELKLQAMLASVASQDSPRAAA